MEKRIGRSPDPYIKSPGQAEKEKREKASRPVITPTVRKPTYGGSYGEGRRGRSARSSY
jgi:hypothetical protein